MNVEPSSGTPSPSGSGPPGNQRKERGAIAAQACETCRNRKQKCDERRPRCGTCQKFDLQCNYREPQPTKKDKTLVEILDRLRAIEGKVDHIGNQRDTPQPVPRRPPHPPAGSSGESVPTSASLHQSGPGSPGQLGLYRYASATHQMMTWPVVSQVLDQVLPQGSEVRAALADADPPSILLEQQASRQRGLPTDGMEVLTMNDRALIGVPLDAHGGVGGVELTDLSWQTMENLSKAYFDTFNYIHPIMDRQTFSSTLLTSVFNNGFDASVTSTLVCLVLALGTVAIADSQNVPLAGYKSPGGSKNTNELRPPGLPFFNEARKRLGFTLTDVSLENVQIFALAGLYYESCCRHMDFWRMTMSASMACRALISSKPGELASDTRANLVRRVFWHCSIMETSLNLEMELPLTGLEAFEDVVGLPDLNDSFLNTDYLDNTDYLENQESHFQEHFASQIALRRLSVQFHNMLRNALGPTTPPTPFSPAPSSDSSSVYGTVQLQVSHLDSWRSMLPPFLRWSENRAAQFPPSVPGPGGYFGQGAMYAPQQAVHDMFTADLSQASAPYPYATDVRVALLRTRYHYIKHLIYRPFLYKVLHHASTIGSDDAKAAAECLKACLKWPLIMAPTCYRKRLIPCLFFWTQNLLGVLIVLHLSRQLPILQQIRAQFCGSNFDLEANETVNLAIAWIRDLKDVDPTADWCWDIVSHLYGLDDG